MNRLNNAQEIPGRAHVKLTLLITSQLIHSLVSVTFPSETGQRIGKIGFYCFAGIIVQACGNYCGGDVESHFSPGIILRVYTGG